MAHLRPEDMEGITAEEVSKMTKAMKNEQFRQYMDEYSRETSDPKHRKEYLDYLMQLEAKGEMPEGQQLLRCQPGVCVKTNLAFKSGQFQKCFINIVHSDRIADLKMDRQDSGGHNVHLPYSLGPPRQERDKKDAICMTCDFAVSTRTFVQAVQHPNILKMLVDTAAENLQQNFLKGHEDVKKDFKVMRNMKCKGGIPMPMSVRAELLTDKGKGYEPPGTRAGKVMKDAVTPGELRQMRNEAKEKKAMEQKDMDDEDEEAERRREQQQKKKAAEEAEAPTRIRVPKHKLVYSGTIDLADYMEKNQQANTISNIPKLLKLSVEVPSVKKVGDINLEVTSNNVVVEVEGKYYLDLPLPYEIEDMAGTAKFDKVKQVLNLELPVIPKAPDPVAMVAFAGGDENQTADCDGGLRDGEDTEDELPPLEDTDAGDVPPRQVDADAPVLDATSPPASPPAAAKPPSPTRREFLEVGSSSDSLRIAQPSLDDAADSEPAVQDDGESQEYGEPPPDFEAAAGFDGVRLGCCFKLGDKGLGYYRDSRQPWPPKGAKRTPAEISLTSEPKVQQTSSSLITPCIVEVFREEENRPKEPLPDDLRRQIDDISALSERIKDDELLQQAPSNQEWPVEWHQSRSNFILTTELPARCQVADLRLSLVGRRLSVFFCTREVDADGKASSSLWRRHVVRRVLVGTVDPTQWHAELTSGTVRQLVLVLRKLDRVTWVEAFDTAAAASSPATAWDSSVLGHPSEAVAQGGSTGSRNRGGGNATTSGSAAVDLEALDDDCGDLAVAGACSVVEDSAELDAAEPLVHHSQQDGGSAQAVQGPRLDASGVAALKQSAAAMGQAVLLRSRLMYQIL